MKFFLERVAKDLFGKYRDEMSCHCLVFPSRRAGLFFRKYYSSMLDKPAWAPSILTIGDLFGSLSKLRKAENELLLFELYRSYCTVTNSKESFDSFYFWGDMILNDFDDVDKYLADPVRLFRNVKELKTIDQQFADLTSEQIEAVRQFWIHFNPSAMTDAKSGFVAIWSVLGELYSVFRTRLTGSGQAYEGMIYRDVAENFRCTDINQHGWSMIHFIGMNALNECEKAVMLELKKAGNAKFYWDYDNSYIRERDLNSAGHFLRDNLNLFGNDMPVDWDYNTNISGETGTATYRIIDTSSDLAQVRMVPALLRELSSFNPPEAHETAVILADENLLLPLISGLSSLDTDVNITMGFPLRHTLAGSFIYKLTVMQTNIRTNGQETLFNSQDVTDILRHPLFTGTGAHDSTGLIERILALKSPWVTESFLNEALPSQKVFRRLETGAQLSAWIREILSSIAVSDLSPAHGGLTAGKDVLKEFIYRVILSVNRLDTALMKTGLEISKSTWLRILDRLLMLQTVPFSGEPLTGLQIMGILESRALDFRNLIVLSAGEGCFPSTAVASSFIPFSLREAFGMPSINHRESVFAYHFYRLLHRAENVTFIYNSGSEGIRSGEMSRFLQQLKYNNKLRPEFFTSGYSILNNKEISNIIHRTGEHTESLKENLEKEKGKLMISATAINMWLNCRMKFYYRYVCGLEEPPKNVEEIDHALLGTLLHEAMRHLYSSLNSEELSAVQISAMLSSDDLINNSVDQAFAVTNTTEKSLPATGYELLARQVLHTFIKRALHIDREIAPFIIEGLEVPFKFKLTEINGIEIFASGRIDRIDNRMGFRRIVDYKTGEVADTISSISSLFEEDRKKPLDGWLQTLFYTEGFFRSDKTAKLTPAIYMLRKPAGAEPECRLFIKKSKESAYAVDDYTSVREEFNEGLGKILNSIFSNDEPFIMTDSGWGKCSYCIYKKLCLR